jgi:hypothetical protein
MRDRLFQQRQRDVLGPAGVLRQIAMDIARLQFGLVGADSQPAHRADS